MESVEGNKHLIQHLKIQRSAYEKSSASARDKVISSVMANSTLTTLDLYRNSIRPNGAVALSEALKANSTLTTLSLGGNSIEDNGAVALSEALKTNSTLTTLNLYNNSIGDNGAQALSDARNTNSTVAIIGVILSNVRALMPRPYAVNTKQHEIKINIKMIPTGLNKNELTQHPIDTLSMYGSAKVLGRYCIWKAIK
ncbi:hypothetical protein BGX23_009408 [Mortierella sp. AD031]|nr:hypothetical protein BGX23_009408 [Mortierella sp. AD031]